MEVHLLHLDPVVLIICTVSRSPGVGAPVRIEHHPFARRFYRCPDALIAIQPPLPPIATGGWQSLLNSFIANKVFEIGVITTEILMMHRCFHLLRSFQVQLARKSVLPGLVDHSDTDLEHGEDRTVVADTEILHRLVPVQLDPCTEIFALPTTHAVSMVDSVENPICPSRYPGFLA